MTDVEQIHLVDDNAARAISVDTSEWPTSPGYIVVFGKVYRLIEGRYYRRDSDVSAEEVHAGFLPIISTAPSEDTP